MELRLLGPLEVVDASGAPVPLRSPQQRRLLAVLGLAGGRAVSTDAIMDALWADEPPDTARQAVQVYVSSLRKRLGSAAIETTPPGYRLVPGVLRLDVERFVALVAGAQQTGPPERDGTGPGSAVDTLGQALAVWRGAALADFADEGFAQTEIARLEEMRAGTLQAWLQARLEAGEAAELVPELRTLVRRYPLHERFVQLLMRALYRSGRQSDALEAFRDAREVLADELGLEPSRELQDLQVAILAQDPGLAAPPPARTADPVPAVPSFASPLVGRDGELAQLTGLLTGGRCRLVSLTGPGGVGKTRLAAEAAARLGEEPRPSAFVDLAAVSDPDRVPAAVAAALGVQLTGSSAPAVTVAEALRGRRLLLVLDNFEQVLPAAGFVAELLTGAPGLTVLVTTRTPLRLGAEQRVAVQPLGVPDEGPGRAERSGAVQLFLQCARQSQPAAVWDGPALAAAARICAGLDGLPLAIEITAARLSMLTVHQLADMVQQGAPDWASPHRDAPGRQRTLSDTVAWSYRLLPEPAARTFRHLAVFPASGDAEALAAVVGTPVGLVLDALETLADSSLAFREPGGDQVRFRMLRVVREYAAQALQSAGEADSALARHAEHYTGTLAQPVARAGAHRLFPRTHEQAASWQRERENLRLALGTARRTDRDDLLVPLALTLAQPWWSAPAETLQLLDLLLQRQGPDGPDRLDLLIARAVCLLDTGAMDGAQAPLADVVSAASARGDDARLSKGQALQAYLLGLAGDAAASRAEQQLSVAAARRSGDAEVLSAALAMAGVTDPPAVDPRWALNRLGAAFQLARGSGNSSLVELVLVNLSEVALGAGEAAAARQWATEAAQAATAIGYRLGRTYAVGNLAAALLLLGEPAQAEEPLRTALVFAWDLRELRAALEYVLWHACLCAGRDRLPEAAAFLAAYDANLQQQGGAMSPVESRLRGTLLAEVDHGPAGRWAMDAFRGGLWTLEDCVNLALGEDPVVTAPGAAQGSNR